MNSSKNPITRFLFAVACLSPVHPGSIATDPNRMNVLGSDLKPCGMKPLTGYYRDGYCATGKDDTGIHVVCSVLTDSFLNFSKSKGNDLISPKPEYGFPGLKAGDRWCLCADRWKEAEIAGKAPPVVLESTHQKAVDIISLSSLKNRCN